MTLRKVVVLQGAALAFALLFLVPLRLFAQVDSVIKVDLVTNTLAGRPPFDQAFVLRVEMPKGADSLQFQYGEACGAHDPKGARFCSAPPPWSRRKGGLIEATAVDFEIPELPPNRNYLFRFTVFGKVTVPETDPAKISIGTRDTVIAERVTESAARRDTTLYIRPLKDRATRDSLVSEVRTIRAETEADFTKHFDSDFGVFVTHHNPGPGYIGAGTNVHFYFVPINKQEEEFSTSSLRDQLFKRVSVFAGLSFVTLQAKEEVKNRYDLGSPLFGLGLKPRFYGRLKRLDFFRVNGGMVYFKQDVGNPLVSNDKIKHAPFVSVTGDITLKEILGPLATLVGVKG